METVENKWRIKLQQKVRERKNDKDFMESQQAVQKQE
jgi:hypothetical protein